MLRSIQASSIRIIESSLINSLNESGTQQYYRYRRKITINSSQVTGTPENVPVRIDISDNTNINKNIRLNGQDVMFTASDGITKLKHNMVAAEKVLERNAVWTWYNDPRAIRAIGSGYDNTIMGWMNNIGDVYIGSFNNDNKEWSTFKLKTALQTDDHNNPGLLLLNDGRIMAVYSSHASTTMFCRVSTNAGDISSWGSEVSITGINSSYANPVQFSDGRIRVYFRRSGQPGYSTGTYGQNYVDSTDDGITWGALKLWLVNDGERPYLKMWQDDDIVHFCYTDAHPNEVTAGTNNLYHCYYNYDTDSYYKSDGTLISTTASLPFTPPAGTKIYNASSTGYNSWNAQILKDTNGLLAVAYYECRNSKDLRLRYASYITSGKSTSWVSYEVKETGGTILGSQFQYFGGATIDPYDANIIYYSSNKDGNMQIFKGVTANNGTTFSEEQLTFGEASKSCRPFAVKNYHSNMKLLYWGGDQYQSYTDYYCSLKSYPQQGSKLDFIADVRIPSLTSASDTDIYMYYDNPSGDGQSDKTNTYNDKIGIYNGTLGCQNIPVSEVNLASKPNVVFLFQINTRTLDSSHDGHFASNWNSTTPSSARFICRKGNAGSNETEFFMLSSTGQVSATYTDLTMANNSSYGWATKFVQNSITGYMNGVKSTISATSTGASFAHGVPNSPINMNDSDHVGNGSMNGSVNAVHIYDGTNIDDDWLKTMTNNFGDVASFITVGSIEIGKYYPY